MEKIVIIKLGAKGDVIRTLPIVKAIKSKFPESELTWVTKDNAKELLRGIQYIDKILTTTEEEFDILYNFDIDKEATSLANKVKAKEKFGFSSQDNFVSAFNLGAEYYLNTLFDDEIKRTNTKTYQEMMFMAAEIPYSREHVGINLNEEDIRYAKEFAKTNGIPKEKLIGIHMGASPRWPSKVWHRENLKEFIKKAKEKGYGILLFGGPNEQQEHANLISDLENQGIFVYKNNPNNTDKQFASLVNLCNAMVCSDSFAMHISIALEKPTIGLFFCTTPHEVESYNLLTKIVSQKIYDFFPEKQDQYSEELTKSISASEVLSALENVK